MPQDAAGSTVDHGHKIAEVVDQTGVSKELIHHYLRQGVLPPSGEKARYSEHQVRLLHLIRVLREDHHLPLEVIRQTFETFDYDADLLETLVLAEPLGKRLAGYGPQRDLSLSPALSRDELAAAAGITTEQLERYLEHRVVDPVVEDGRERFTVFDANAIRLCERGAALDIPFDSFRTIASYMRVAFELQRQAFFASLWGGELPLAELLDQVFVRRELVGSFVQNQLQTLEQRYLGDFLQRGDARPARLDAVIYRPSAVFLRRHGLRAELDRRTARMTAAPDDADAWQATAEAQLHLGWYREAAFFLEQAVERWPERGDLRTQYGMALALSGEAGRGEAQLRAVVDAGDPPPEAAVWLALVCFTRLGQVDEGAPVAAGIRTLVDGALAEGGARPTLHVQLYGGWLLTALPPALGDRPRGLALLADTCRELDRGERRLGTLPGLRERYRLNAAALLLEALARDERRPDGDGLAGGRDPAELRDLIYRLDPACDLAERVYLEDRAHPGAER